MKTVGIIAEYNPFHKGHAYHIEESLRMTGAEHAVVIMSGDFVQRGEPAILNKYFRTKTALLNGASLVLELPSVYALSSAEGFASGAVSVLDNLGVIDFLSFGSECGDLPMLRAAARFLTEPHPELDALIREHLKSGISYPASVSEALSKTGQSGNIFEGPNNLLSIEYLKALLLQKSSMIPVTLKREGDPYLSETPDPESTFASARDIRGLMEKGDDRYGQYLCENVPVPASEKILRPDDFSELLYYKLLSEKEAGYERYLDVNEELSNRIRRALEDYTSLTDFILQLKSKNYTYARLSRCLFHILLNITDELLTEKVDYIRILGFKKSAQPLLGALKKHTSLPLVTKLSDAPKSPLLQKDIDCALLYEQVSGRHSNEIRQSPVIL